MVGLSISACCIDTLGSLVYHRRGMNQLLVACYRSIRPREVNLALYVVFCKSSHQVNQISWKVCRMNIHPREVNQPSLEACRMNILREV